MYIVLFEPHNLRSKMICIKGWYLHYLVSGEVSVFVCVFFLLLRHLEFKCCFMWMEMGCIQYRTHTVCFFMLKVRWYGSTELFGWNVHVININTSWIGVWFQREPWRGPRFNWLQPVSTIFIYFTCLNGFIYYLCMAYFNTFDLESTRQRLNWMICSLQGLDTAEMEYSGKLQ